jgi:hypothetical protein
MLRGFKKESENTQENFSYPSKDGVERGLWRAMTNTKKRETRIINLFLF